MGAVRQAKVSKQRQLQGRQGGNDPNDIAGSAQHRYSKAGEGEQAAAAADVSRNGTYPRNKQSPICMVAENRQWRGS